MGAAIAYSVRAYRAEQRELAAFRVDRQREAAAERSLSRAQLPTSRAGGEVEAMATVNLHAPADRTDLPLVLLPPFPLDSRVWGDVSGLLGGGDHHGRRPRLRQTGQAM